MASTKSINTIVLDTGAIIRNHPTVSSLIAQAEQLITVPAIIFEIRDAATRSRVETTLQPFLTLRTPNPQSMKVVTDFARKTGDLAVLSKPDIQIIALAYELECERNGGDWRLRRNPGQKGLNGAPPSKESLPVSSTDTTKDQPADSPAESHEAVPEIAGDSEEVPDSTADAVPATSEVVEPTSGDAGPTTAPVVAESKLAPSAEEAGNHTSVDEVVDDLDRTKLSNEEANADNHEAQTLDTVENDATDIPPSDSESDSEGWITPSNLKRHQEKDANGSIEQTAELKTMQVATLTTDFAMQNVILQMNLNLLSPAMQRVKHLKTFVLRCHACFQVCKQMDKQFCVRCGKPTLTRVACSTNANGEFKLHLKQNMQWNHRGDRFSIPKPVSGSAHGRVKGGGKGGWGNELVLAEDQKEYARAVGQEKRTKERNLMDEDYLPSILTGDRSKSGGRIKVGAGRTVNSRKR